MRATRRPRGARGAPDTRALLNLNACGAERAPNAGGALVRIDGAVVVLINLEPVEPVL